MEDISNNGNNFNKSELWSLSIRDLFYKYVRFLPVFVLSVALALLGAFAYLRWATPIYATSATLLIKSEQQTGRNDKFEDIFGGGKSQNIQSEIEVLKSRPLMMRVVQKKNLQFSYNAKGKIKTLNVYTQGPFLLDVVKINDSTRPFVLKVHFNSNKTFKVNNSTTYFTYGQMFENVFGAFILRKNNNGEVARDYTVTYTPTEQAAAVYASLVQVIPKSVGTGILNIGMQTTNPQLGADIINQLMAEYGDYTKELKKRTSDSTLAFIDERLNKLGRELDTVQDKLLRYSQENNLIDMDKQSTVFFDNISEADKNINELQMQLSNADFIDNYLRSDKSKGKYEVVPVPSSLGLTDPTLNELVASYNTLQIERSSLLDGNVPPSNPAVLEVNAQIEKLRVSLLENLGNIKKSYSGMIGSVQSRSNSAQSQLKSLPFKERGYYQIKLQVETKQALFNLLQEKREETAISRAATMENSQVVEDAYVPSAPVRPKKRSIQIMAILLGLAIPALFIFGSEVLNDKVSTRFDVEKITTAPILGEVGHSYSDKTLIVNRTTRSMVAEQFRIIRSNLQYITGKTEKTTILVTSSFSGEGKSFISINTGSVMALAGKKTVILEFDIRKPKVLSGLGMPKGPGITNLLIGNATIEELIKPVPEHDKLFVLGCGPIPPNPSELLLDPRVDEIFDYLKKEFDVIIIDTAPVGMVSDAQTLSKYANCTLYIVRQGYTFKKQITLIDEFYREHKLPAVSIIINDVKIKPGYGYYGYGRYGYGYGQGYGYGNYYEEEQESKGLLERMIDRANPANWFGKR